MGDADDKAWAIVRRLAESEPIMPTIGQYMCRYCFGEGDIMSVGHRSTCTWIASQVLLGSAREVIDAQA